MLDIAVSDTGVGLCLVTALTMSDIAVSDTASAADTFYVSAAGWFLKILRFFNF